MNKKNSVLASVLYSSALCLALLASPAIAQDKKAAEKPAVAASAAGNPFAVSGVAIIDVQALMKDSKAAESIRKQVEKKRDEYQKSIEALEKKLKAEEATLVKEKDSADQKAFAEKRKAFEKQVAEAQQTIQKNRATLERGFAEAMSKLRGEIVKIVADIAAAKKVDLVLTRSQVVIVDSSMDITKEVLNKLNEKTTSIDVSFK